MRRLLLSLVSCSLAGCLVGVDETLWEHRDRGAVESRGPDSFVLPDRPSADVFVVPDAGCPKGFTQCGTVCADLTSDPAHCNTCNNPCPATTDRCVAGKCRCGPEGDACASTLNCVAGICRCAAGGLCNGCCDGNTCLSSGQQTLTLCGKGGLACKSCATTNPCVTGSCSSGVCLQSNVTNGTDCDDGLFCTPSSKCSGGKCAGAQMSCSQLDDACNTGTCSEFALGCVKMPKKNGTGCDLDGKYCTDDACQGGTCTAGGAPNCSYLDQQCVTGICTEAAKGCTKQSLGDGTKCDDQNPCTDPDTCTGGVCGGTKLPDDTACGFMNQKCCAGTCCGMGTSCCGTSCCNGTQQCCSGVCKQYGSC